MNAVKRNFVLAQPALFSRGRQSARLWGLLLSLVVFITSIAASPTQQSAPDQINAPSGPWTIYTVDAPPLFHSMTDRSMRYRPDGVPCVAYGGDHLYYACYNTITKSWDSSLIDASYQVGGHAALAFNRFNNPYITYYDGYHGWLKLAYRSGGIWNIIVVDTGVMAMDRTREKTISPQLQELYAKIDLRPWRDPLLEDQSVSSITAYVDDTVGVGKYTSIAIDSDEAVHMSYYDELNGNLKYAYWNGVGLPVNETVDSYHDQGDVGLYTSIAVFLDGDRQRPIISYMDEKYDNLKAAVKSGGVWDKWEVEARSSGVGTFNSIALASDNRPYISYLNFNNYSLKVAYLNNDKKTWTKGVVDSSGVLGLYTSLSIDSTNQLHISYYDAGNGDLKYARYANNSWTIVKVDTAGDVGIYSSVSTHPVGDKAGKLGISYFNVTQGAFRFVYLHPQLGWQPSTIGFAGDVGVSTSLAMTDAGIPHISYMDDALNRIKYTQYIGDVWMGGGYWAREFITPTIGVGPFSSIALRGGFDPVLAFNDTNKADVRFGERLGSSWTARAVQRTYEVGQFVSMAMDSTDQPRMVYHDATNGDLIYAYWSVGASRWITDTADFVGYTGRFASLALNSFDRPYMSYYDVSSEKVKMAFISAIDAWVRVDVAPVGFLGDGISTAQAFTSIALDSAGVPHIAYYDDAYGDLMFASWNGAGFNISTIDTGGVGVVVGKYASLAIDPLTDHRHICYYDETNRNLKYAFWNGAWSIEVVDSIGDVGKFCDIALDALGRPGISYYDASMGDLKYASSFVIPDLLIYHIFVPLIKK